MIWHPFSFGGNFGWSIKRRTNYCSVCNKKVNVVVHCLPKNRSNPSTNELQRAQTKIQHWQPCGCWLWQFWPSRVSKLQMVPCHLTNNLHHRRQVKDNPGKQWQTLQKAHQQIGLLKTSQLIHVQIALERRSLRTATQANVGSSRVFLNDFSSCHVTWWNSCCLEWICIGCYLRFIVNPQDSVWHFTLDKTEMSHKRQRPKIGGRGERGKRGREGIWGASKNAQMRHFYKHTRNCNAWADHGSQMSWQSILEVNSTYSQLHQETHLS